jgi:hypothetical protein
LCSIKVSSSSCYSCSLKVIKTIKVMTSTSTSRSMSKKSITSMASMTYFLIIKTARIGLDVIVKIGL